MWCCVQGKKQYSAHTALLKTVVENMPNFIAYKEPRVRNVDPKGKHPAKQDKKTANKTSWMCMMFYFHLHSRYLLVENC